ncbi:transposase family protein [Streptomyces sp. NPDC048179]|uniref:helix-turn-helix domain-containing protein n=1 Tax=Streptomyces sp. NPDC048179 TaxID=3365506 RepID=UPI003721B6E3
MRAHALVAGVREDLRERAVCQQPGQSQLTGLGAVGAAAHQARLAARPRRRAVGAGAKHKFVFVDRLLATLVSLSHGTTHDALACWFGVDRSTSTRAIGEIRPLLAQRGCTIAPDVRLRTLAEVVEYLGVDSGTGIIDGTEIRVRRPAAGRKDRDKFVSGKTKQNAVKTVTASARPMRSLKADHSGKAAL